MTLYLPINRSGGEESESGKVNVLCYPSWPSTNLLSCANGVSSDIGTNFGNIDFCSDDRISELVPNKHNLWLTRVSLISIFLNDLLRNSYSYYGEL